MSSWALLEFKCRLLEKPPSRQVFPALHYSLFNPFLLTDIQLVVLA
jgi:hypothetical protein